jgi:hypothetical protein
MHTHPSHICTKWDFLQLFSRRRLAKIRHYLSCTMRQPEQKHLGFVGVRHLVLVPYLRFRRMILLIEDEQFHLPITKLIVELVETL